ncbi:MAG: thioredoxin family protein [Chloroflexota bacterium]
MNVFSQFSNQFSYILFSLLAIVGATLLLWRARVRRTVIGIAAIALGVAAATGWVLLRPGEPDVDSVEAAEALIQSDKPTLVEFFSNYCVGCMSVRGMVDELVSQTRAHFGDDVHVLRIDIHTPSGRELRERYGFSYTPEFIIFRGNGIEAWRSHTPPTFEELETIVTDNRSTVSG